MRLTDQVVTGWDLVDTGTHALPAWRAGWPVPHGATKDCDWDYNCVEGQIEHGGDGVTQWRSPPQPPPLSRCTTTTPRNRAELEASGWVFSCAPKDNSAGGAGAEGYPAFTALGSGVCATGSKRLPYCQKNNLPDGKCKELCDADPSCTGYNPATHGNNCFLFWKPDAPLNLSGWTNCHNRNTQGEMTGHDSSEGGMCYKKVYCM